MKKIILILIIFFQTNLLKAQNNIVYLDVQFIIDNSELGKFYKTKLLNTQDKKKKELKAREILIKDTEKKINNQKNILKKEEINNKLNELNKIVKAYQKQRKDASKQLLDEKKNYTTEILKILNPLLTKYVEKNNISLVLEKKNVLVGVKTLDITNDLIKIFNNETKEKKLIDED